MDNIWQNLTICPTCNGNKVIIRNNKVVDCTTCCGSGIVQKEDIKPDNQTDTSTTTFPSFN